VEIESTSVEVYRKEPENFQTIESSDYRAALVSLVSSQGVCILNEENRNLKKNGKECKRIRQCVSTEVEYYF